MCAWWAKKTRQRSLHPPRVSDPWRVSRRNVRRSMRDYAVYFVTLTLGVAVFYAFNTIEDFRVLF